MTLWFIFALMTAAAIFAVLWPLGRKAEISADNDIAVYRAQLEEIAADRAAGRIGEDEAQAARLEISRRLLAAADRAPAAAAAADSPWRRRAVALAALVLLPLGAGSLYLSLGSPHQPGQSAADRRAPPSERDSIVALVARVEAHLAQNPGDARGWEVLAPVYMQLGRFDDAVNARLNVLRIMGASAAREADVGEALAAAAGGIVSADARAAFQRALALDATEPKARFFIGLAAEQDGKPAEAAAIWRDLLNGAPSDAPWADVVRRSLARVEGATPGPTDKDISAADAMTAEQRAAMVQGMVARLAERLKTDGSDVEGWLRLLRSYMVLGERDKALAAAADARRALASDPDKLKRVNELIKGLGLEG
jgi:cytochrome c-type biogenesis protein CcmH